MYLDRLLSKGCIGPSVAQDSPSKHEAYPTKVFEYMAMGMPVVASDLKLTRLREKRSRQGGCGVLASADDAGAYVDTALAILDDPCGLSSTAGTAGRLRSECPTGTLKGPDLCVSFFISWDKATTRRGQT
jgi:glycosyltransferase involved in cell wall biosynthesis